MSELSEQQLSAIMPACPNPADWVPPLNSAMAQFDITGSRRMAAFLAQIAHESGQLTRLSENLNYSAKRLTQVWPERFPTVERAAAFENNPEKLANHVYAGRLGNRDEASGDGWRFRGRGLIQLTGRSNYRAASRGTGLPLEDQPELLDRPVEAAISSAWFWKSKGLNGLADEPGNERENFKIITRRINGGALGLHERLTFWERAKAALAG